VHSEVATEKTQNGQTLRFINDLHVEKNLHAFRSGNRKERYFTNHVFVEKRTFMHFDGAEGKTKQGQEAYSIHYVCLGKTNQFFDLVC